MPINDDSRLDYLDAYPEDCDPDGMMMQIKRQAIKIAQMKTRANQVLNFQLTSEASNGEVVLLQEIKEILKEGEEWA